MGAGFGVGRYVREALFGIFFLVDAVFAYYLEHDAFDFWLPSFHHVPRESVMS